MARLPLTPSAWTLSLLAAAGLTGCATPAVQAPPAPLAGSSVPAQFKEAGHWQRAAALDTQPVPEAWWTLFRDPALDALQDRLLAGNQTLQAGLAQVAGARALLDASRNAGLPTLSAGLTANRSANPAADSASGRRQASTSLTLAADASWEIDLWGRLGQGVNNAQASYQASRDDLASARLSAQATLAETWFALRTADAQGALLARSVLAYQRSAELTEVRYEGGVAGRSDVLQAQTQLRTAQAQVIEAGAQRALLAHAIAVLLGVAPSALDLAVDASLPQAPAVPELLPSTLIERRPDIAAAERRVAAAQAQIGIADAAYFPSLTLSAGSGYRNDSLSRLASAPNLFWSLGTALAQTVLDSGQRRLASAQARASAEQSTALYRQTVLVALQEVEDNLVLAQQLGLEAGLQQQALQSAQRNLEITLDQYRAGTVSYLNVVIAQTAALSSESSWLATRNRQLAAVNQLLKNIGGRWPA